MSGLIQSEFPMLTLLAKHTNKNLVILDTETTGLPNQAICGIVEFGALAIYVNGTQDEREFFINPGIPIPYAASKVHGIHDHHVKSAPALDKMKGLIENTFGRSIISGFNTRTFDIPVICKDFRRYGIDMCEPSHQLDVRDVHLAAAKTQKGKLHEVAEKYGVTPDTAHRAMGDVRTTARILEAMIFEHGLDFVLSVQQRKTVNTGSSLGVTPKPKSGMSSPAQVIPVSVTPEVKPPKETQKSRITRAIMTHIAKHEFIELNHYAHIAEESGSTLTSVSFRISEMYVNNELHRSHIESISVQEIIQDHLESAINEAGGLERLKPIKEALDRMTAMDIDYIQLRIALDDFKLRNEDNQAMR